MLFLEFVLNGFAVAATIVATLRAGSRGLYISNHGAIGLVDGPSISPPPPLSKRPTTDNDNDNEISTNEDSDYNPALYELSENFKHCIRISSSVLNNGRFGYKNMARDRPAISSAASVIDSDTSDAEVASSKSVQILQQLNDLVTEEQRKRDFKSNQRKRKDPYRGSEGYTLGYTPYEPKTFSNSEDNTELRSTTNTSNASATKAKENECTDEDGADGLWDYGVATEADFFYKVEGRSTKSLTARRKRVAQLTAYSPKAFSDLRSSVFGIPEPEFLRSVLSNLVSFQSNSKGAARAGGIFFFTSDGAYMIKTIPEREKETFLKMLPKYHKHMKKHGRSSLLTRFCGMYGITIQQEDRDDESTTGKEVTLTSKSDDPDPLSPFAPTEKEYTFVVMNAVFPAEADKFISERFDLKGSTVGREVSPEELASKGSRAVLKDLDLSREVQAGQGELIEGTAISTSKVGRVVGGFVGRWKRKGGKDHHSVSKRSSRTGFTIGATAKAALLSQLRKDVEFLTECQVMDYSLLVGVVHRKDPVPTSEISQSEPVETLETQRQVLERLEGPSTGAAVATATTPLSKHRPKLNASLMNTVIIPFRLLLSPPIYVARKSWNVLRLTLDTVATAPMPYYGSGLCGVDGGKLSVLHGKRKGDRAIYYLGLIDFLQPWSTRKVLERKLKGLAGYDTDAISAVTPEEYANRFLKFLDDHIQ